MPRSALFAMAVLLAAASVFYGGMWMFLVRQPANRVELGFNFKSDTHYDPISHSIPVSDVVPRSPAEGAGLLPGDRIIAVNGEQLRSSNPFDRTWGTSSPGDGVELTVQRPGAPAPITLHAIFRALSESRAPESAARSSAEQATESFPVFFLAVGFIVLFLRPENRYAWLLAALFCAIVAAPPLVNSYILAAVPRQFMYLYRSVFCGMLPALFYIFFALFPARSPLERSAPWLKWAAIAFGMSRVLPSLQNGVPGWPAAETHAGIRLTQFVLLYGFLGLGLISLAANRWGKHSPTEVCRKSGVILWGTVIGFVPVLSERAAADLFGYHPSFWVDAGATLVLALYPLSFAYAVIKARVLEIPMLLRRSARYLLVQRGFLVLLVLVAAGAILLFTRTLGRYVGAGSFGMTASAIFGVALVWAAAPVVRRGTERIDRAFFRSAYDSRMILRDLAERTRTTSSREELAALLQEHIEGALHPKTLACYFRAQDGELIAMAGGSPLAPARLARKPPILVELAKRAQIVEIADAGEHARLGALAALAPECLAPILGRDGRLVGALVLGQRLSEEPYSGEDEGLLTSVASQAGVALENIELAESMAERMESERRIQQEIAFARQVQARLFPQKLPPLAKLDYAGACSQARQVGGDYYDFLELSPGRVAMVLADIAGKGISGALLMANLQANLRSQYALALQDLQKLLTTVNRLFYENTDEAGYATLFFADYDDSTRRLRYVNAGHLPALLLRGASCSQVEKLSATSTVFGLFDPWECNLAEVQLATGDVLILYSDGVTENTNSEGEEFGEPRLLEEARRNSHLPASEMLSAIMATVQQFGGREQADDITLVVARCHE